MCYKLLRNSFFFIVFRLDLDYLQQIRSQIPITLQRRSDMYEVVEKKN